MEAARQQCSKDGEAAKGHAEAAAAACVAKMAEVQDNWDHTLDTATANLESSIVNEGRAVRTVVKAAVAGEAADRAHREQQILSDTDAKLAASKRALKQEVEQKVGEAKHEAKQEAEGERAARERKCEEIEKAAETLKAELSKKLGELEEAHEGTRRELSEARDELGGRVGAEEEARGALETATQEAAGAEKRERAAADQALREDLEM